MSTITIPKELTKKGDLVVIPRKNYEALLRALHAKKKQIYDAQLDKELDKAIAEYKAGKVAGPFSSVRQLKKSLGK